MVQYHSAMPSSAAGSVVLRRCCDEIDALCIASEQGSQWVFSSQCTAHQPSSVHVSKVRLLLDGIDALRFEGVYDLRLHRRSRVYETLHGVSIQLVEEDAQTGGQGCLWAASLVLARFIERNFARFRPGCKVLELGAGAGLPTLVAAAYGMEATATEQTTCLRYLQTNLSLNSANIPARGLALQWGKEFRADQLDQEKFDVILGGDITYDPSAFEVLFETINRFSQPTTEVYICHDNDACPLSPSDMREFKELADAYNLRVENLGLAALVDRPFYHRDILFQKLTRAS